LLALGLLGTALSTTAALLALAFTVLTAGLLVWDLKRPDRFWRVVLTPNLRSWLPWGAYILMAFGLVSLLWLVAAAVGSAAPGALLWTGVALGLAAAGYSAFLFGQAEGRDFWQSPLLLPQLLGGAALAGAASLVLAGSALGGSSRELSSILLAALVAMFAVIALELYTPHSNKDVAAAAHYLTTGDRAAYFWSGAVVLGFVVPVVLLIAALAGAPTWFATIAAICALAGLWFYEDAWVRAGQSVAMS
jgi:formate-dependent nitrite reductase membrane component NrfD